MIPFFGVLFLLPWFANVRIAPVISRSGGAELNEIVTPVPRFAFRNSRAFPAAERRGAKFKLWRAGQTPIAIQSFFFLGENKLTEFARIAHP